MKTTLFSCMPNNMKSGLLERQYDSGSSILLADNENNYVYFLCEGFAEAYIQNLQGSIAAIYTYTPDSVFGEVEPFYQGLKPVSIIAITACKVLMLHKSDYIEWLKSDFKAVSVLISILAEKLATNSMRIEEISLMNVQERVLRRIAIHAYGNRLHLLTKQQISLEANTPIRSVNRAIKKCEDAGLFIYKNGYFEILNEKAVMQFLPPLLQK